MDVSEIVDGESFRVWLEQQPFERRSDTAMALAARAALRVFPLWAAEMPEEWARKGDLTVLSVARSVVIPSVAANEAFQGMEASIDSARLSVAAASRLANRTSSVSTRAARASASSARAASRSAASARASAYATSSAESFVEAYANVAFSVYDSAASAMIGAWSLLLPDCAAVLTGHEVQHCPLWPQKMPTEIARGWAKGRAWMETAPGHAFWIRWYEAILAGRPLTQDWDSHWQLMHDIALIPDKEWGEGKEQDAIRVAGIIAEIEDKYRPTQLSNVDRSTVDAKLSTQEVQAGLRTNRLSLPPTLDAVFGHLELEIQRLSGVNHWQTEEAFHEARALIARLRAMQSAVDQLRVQAECLPEEPSMVDAEEAKSALGQIYASLKSWPKGKEDELSDATWRIGLIGLTTGVFCLAGAPALVGAGVGGMFFGAKHLEQGAKAVKAFRAMQTEEKED